MCVSVTAKQHSVQQLELNALIAKHEQCESERDQLQLQCVAQLKQLARAHQLLHETAEDAPPPTTPATAERDDSDAKLWHERQERELQRQELEAANQLLQAFHDELEVCQNERDLLKRHAGCCSASLASCAVSVCSQIDLSCFSWLRTASYCCHLHH